MPRLDLWVMFLGAILISVLVAAGCCIWIVFACCKGGAW